MIKKFLEFVKGSKESIGKEIESLLDGDSVSEEQKRHIMEAIVKPSVLGWQAKSGKVIDASIAIANVIDSVLDDSDRRDIEMRLKEYLERGVEEKEVGVSASADLEEIAESVAFAGKGIFHSFLKALTALGQKEKPLSQEKCPDEFLLYHLYEGLDADAVRQVFARFKSLDMYSDRIDNAKSEAALYFGIKCDASVEYGLHYEERAPLGGFALSQSVVRWLTSLDSKSLFSMKKELVNLAYSDIVALGKIKSDMSAYSPGYCEGKMAPVLKDRVVSFGYYGAGKWDNGKLDEGELANIKSNFVAWLMPKRWSEKVLISVKAGSFWVYVHIKLK